jgi:hypothetical protein
VAGAVKVPLRDPVQAIEILPSLGGAPDRQAKMIGRKTAGRRERRIRET